MAGGESVVQGQITYAALMEEAVDTLESQKAVGARPRKDNVAWRELMDGRCLGRGNKESLQGTCPPSSVGIAFLHHSEQ